ncbi:cytochrome P450 2C5-like [Eleutherodactylus coqui]|uniref:cytochrome P450 2C5-like n=1 Tax=Eleutherodactylus coqui TaxID=57060 RepID=UPI003463570F
MNLSDPTTLVLSVILCLFVALFFFGRKRSGKYNLPPGPRPLPIIGNLHILDLKKPYQTLHQLSKKYGSVYTIKLGEEEAVVLCGYETVKDALVNHADEFSGRPKVPLFDEMTKGYGVIMAHNDNWKVMRRFTLSTLRDFGMGKEGIENKIIEESDFLVQKFRSYKGEPFDNHMIINAAVANIIVSIVLSHRFAYEDPTLVRLLKIVNEVIKLTGSPAAMLSKKYGPVYTIKLGEEKVVVLCGYEAVKDALVNHADEFSGRAKVPLFHEITKGYGVTFAHDDNWKVMRRFTLSTLRDFGMGKEGIENKITEESDFLVQKFKSYKGEPFDNLMIINAAVANIIVSILLSHRFAYEDPTLVKLLKIINENVKLIGGPMGVLYNAFPSVMRWCSTVQQTVVRNVDELHAFIRETFTNQRKELDVNDQRNLIDAFLVKQQEEKTQLYFSNENLTILVSDLFAAGMETTSTTLRWGLLLMIKHPEIQRTVQSEIEKVIGSAEPLVIHRKQMPYTDAVIHEIQRFGNIIPTNVPHATTQDVNFRGYLLPKGTQVMPLLTSVLYDKKHFVRADEFYPEHFLDSSGNFVRKEAFMPFSAGKRSCAGESLAKMELFIFFTRLLQNFTFQAPLGVTLDLTPASGFTSAPLSHKICAVPRV